eukprot:TRINITY_DN8305_c0_g1_i11.p1 TRINITY_DN8305_c0_g1~~TRINITY_DN8305_c0_g1_i11.p1  ORF type:complete len:295 (+),score=67.57 TRINITY_DN8305_c0_g1_i11:279-1163(+)
MGEFVFRPSNAPDRLRLTWKFNDDTYVDFEVCEEEQVAPLSLGRRLKIGRHEFEDLDHITQKFISHINRYAKDMLNHEKFRFGSLHDIDQLLRVDKENDPKRIPYYVWIDANSKYPGNFTLTCLPNNNLKHEYIRLTPDGYQFRDKTFSKPNELIAWFKKNFTQLATRPRSSPQQPQPPRPREEVKSNGNSFGMSNSRSAPAPSGPRHLPMAPDSWSFSQPHLMADVDAQEYGTRSNYAYKGSGGGTTFSYNQFARFAAPVNPQWGSSYSSGGQSAPPSNPPSNSSNPSSRWKR